MTRIGRYFYALLRKLLFVWVRTRTVGANRSRLGLRPDQPVIYVLQNQSLSNLLVVEQECLEAGLPRPLSSVEIGDREEPRSIFYLLPKRDMFAGPRRASKPSPYLVSLVEAISRDPDLDLQIVPVSVFWGRSPDKENSFFKILLSDTWAVAGRLQKFLIILIQGRLTFVQFNRPISLRDAVNTEVSQTENVRKIIRVLRLHFRNVRASVIGPDLSHRRTLVNSLLDSVPVRKAIELEADSRKIDVRKAQKIAWKYADEIASDISYTVIRMYDLVLTWLWNKIYNGVEINNLDRLKELAADNEIIYTPCHRSHIDYLLLSYVLYHAGLQMPHIAAGINLNMPVVGPILRRGGAFFMRRTFKGNQLYTAVFNEYLHAVFTRGYSVEYFIEGGRSRTGRTLNPRPGMLSMTVRSFLRDSKRPIIFVPVYCGYEKILEERSYLGELRGRKKKKESPLDIIRTLRNLKSNFGKVYVNFGEPVYLDKYLDKAQPDWRTQNYGDEYKPYWLSGTVDRLGKLLVSRINDAVAVNPINLVAVAILSTPKQAIDERALMEQIDLYRRMLKKHRYSKQLTITGMDVRSLISYVEDLGLFSRLAHPLGDILFLEGNNAVLMTYYRNNIMHLLAIPSLLACIFRYNDTVEVERLVAVCQTIYPYLNAELHLRWNESEVGEVTRNWLKILEGEGLLVREGDELHRPPDNTTQFFALDLLADIVRQTIERFYLVIVVLQRAGNGTATAEDLEGQCQLVAQRMSALHGFNAPEFFDKSLFRGFIATLIRMEVLSVNEDGKLNYLQPIDETVADARLTLSNQIRQAIRQLTLAN